MGHGYLEEELVVTVKLTPFKCSISACGKELDVMSEKPDPSLASATIFKATCPSCSRRYTVEVVTIVRIREGDGPHHEGPDEMDL